MDRGSKFIISGATRSIDVLAIPSNYVDPELRQYSNSGSVLLSHERSWLKLIELFSKIEMVQNIICQEK